MGRLRTLAAAALVVAAVAATARAEGKGKILLTGFEPFQGPTNPSWQAVKSLNGKTLNGYEVVAVELAVEWKRAAEQIEAHIRDNRPVAVISFGEGSPGRFDLEEVAHNKVNPNLTDNVGANYTQPKIRVDGPDVLRSSLPLKEIEAAIKAILPQNLDVRRSEYPGAYLCEYVFYLDCYFMKKYGLDGPAGFIHVPYAGTSRTDFAIDQQVVGVTAQALADALDERLPGPTPPSPTPPTPPAPPVSEPTPPAPEATPPVVVTPDPVVPAVTPVVTPPAALPVLSRGATGEDVVKLQAALRAAGIPAGSDGVFGPRVETAVKRLQKRKGIKADGVVGAKTWAALGVAVPAAPSTTSGFLGGLGGGN